jgi:hypothetical protein
MFAKQIMHCLHQFPPNKTTTTLLPLTSEEGDDALSGIFSIQCDTKISTPLPSHNTMTSWNFFQPPKNMLGRIKAVGTCYVHHCLFGQETYFTTRRLVIVTIMHFLSSWLGKKLNSATNDPF